jgi:hypothetical protein
MSSNPSDRALGESEEEWKREFATLAKQARRRVVGQFPT